MRERVPLLLGLVGPSGGGKSYSAQRLAAGIQRVSGGEIYAIDTEARRMLHYADRFKFRHLEFKAPFGSLDYLAALEHCVRKGASIIIVDSLSHEHDGPGGVLERHAEEHERLGGKDSTKMLAWAKPKQERKRLINSILQMPCNFIFCFRAKEKIKLATRAEKAAGDDAVQQLGWMPVAGEEFVYEMTANALLLPGANGVPTWQSSELGERQMIKLPEQFKKLLLEHKGPLDEKLGETMAQWAAGDVAVPSDGDVDKVLAAIAAATTLEAVEAIAAEQRRKRWNADHAGRIRTALVERKERLQGG